MKRHLIKHFAKSNPNLLYNLIPLEAFKNLFQFNSDHNTFIPAQFPSERGFRETMEHLESKEARELLEDLALATRAGRAAQRARQPVRVYARIVPQGEPEFIINRPTVLLNCICILRLHEPDGDDQVIVDRLRGSFPDVVIPARDIQPLFQATCQNCPRWVRELVLVASAHGRDLTWRTIGLLRTNMLAYSPVLPQDHYDDPRDGVRYLQDLVRVPEQDR